MTAVTTFLAITGPITANSHGSDHAPITAITATDKVAVQKRSRRGPRRTRPNATTNGPLYKERAVIAGPAAGACLGRRRLCAELGDEPGTRGHERDIKRPIR
jgi:hypothetical protein